jgi:hypothetical protein
MEQRGRLALHLRLRALEVHEIPPPLTDVRTQKNM